MAALNPQTEMTDALDEFNSAFESATAESNHNESYSTPSSSSNSSQVLNNFEFEEFTNDDIATLWNNQVLDWSNLNYLDSISEDFRQ